MGISTNNDNPYFSTTAGNGKLFFASGNGLYATTGTGSLLSITATGMTTGTAINLTGAAATFMDYKEYEMRQAAKERGKLPEFNALRRLKQ